MNNSSLGRWRIRAIRCSRPAIGVTIGSSALVSNDTLENPGIPPTPPITGQPLVSIRPVVEATTTPITPVNSSDDTALHTARARPGACGLDVGFSAWIVFETSKLAPQYSQRVRPVASRGGSLAPQCGQSSETS